MCHYIRVHDNGATSFAERSLVPVEHANVQQMMNATVLQSKHRKTHLSSLFLALSTLPCFSLVLYYFLLVRIAVYTVSPQDCMSCRNF